MGETLAFSVGYDAFGQPKERSTITMRKYSSKIESEEIDHYDPSKKNWEKNQKQYIFTISAGALSGKQMFVFNKDKQLFVIDKAEYYFFDTNISYQHPTQTVAYKFNEQGDSVLTSFTNSALEFAGKYLIHQLDTILLIVRY